MGYVEGLIASVWGCDICIMMDDVCMVIFADIYIRILYHNIVGHSGSNTVLHPYVTQTALVCDANSPARYLGSGTSINYRNYSNYRYVRICGTPPNHPEMVDYVVFLSETNGS